MRGPVSGNGAGVVSGAYRTSGPVPALYHEDPLFLDLCGAFDELLGPFVAALDCFTAYLDPWLAPEDFLTWLGSLVGVTRSAPAGSAAEAGEGIGAAWASGGWQHRALIAGAVPGYRIRGTADGLRAVVAAAVGVQAGQVAVAEAGSVTWSDVPDTAPKEPVDPAVKITVAIPRGQDPAEVAASARAAAESALPVFSQLQIEVVKS